MNFVQVSHEGHVAKVSLSRPDVRNAFNPEMIEELIEAFTALPKNKDIRAIHFSGQGKSFCAGGDLNWMRQMKDYSEKKNMKDSDRLFRMFEVIMQCPLPIVTTVHGAAFGGALGLIACSDYVICEKETQLCFSEVKLGIAPAVISAFVLHKTTLGHAGPWMMSGQVFLAEQAKQMGLVHVVCEESALSLHTASALAWFKEAGPLAVRQTKQLIHQISASDWKQRRKMTSTLIAKLRTGAEGQEGLSSFLEKRKPSWRLT